jgi:hypothetical protein
VTEGVLFAEIPDFATVVVNAWPVTVGMTDFTAVGMSVALGITAAFMTVEVTAGTVAVGITARFGTE